MWYILIAVIISIAINNLIYRWKAKYLARCIADEIVDVICEIYNNEKNTP